MMLHQPLLYHCLCLSHSLFTSLLLHHLSDPLVEVESAIEAVAHAVAQTTKQQQNVFFDSQMDVPLLLCQEGVRNRGFVFPCQNDSLQEKMDLLMETAVGHSPLSVLPKNRGFLFRTVWNVIPRHVDAIPGTRVLHGLSAAAPCFAPFDG